MATYAIGDLQGCFDTLQSLLQRISFDRERDRLWFVGDLVNRGQKSLECLRFVSSLGDRATVVLGNHDLHLLAFAEGFGRAGRHDTLRSILDAPDRDDLLAWVRRQKLLHVEGDFVLVHAGLLPQWDITLAAELAGEASRLLRGADYRELLREMYSNMPDKWRADLSGMDRLRITINAMTRMRVLTADDRLDLTFAGELANRPADTTPWFERRHESFAGKTIIAGHWSALGLYKAPGFFALDSGCVWGRALTALRLDDSVVFQAPCVESTIPVGWD